MPQPERPFLTARWTELLLLNFPVPTELIAGLAPPGTEPDLFDAQAHVSIVGFQFRDTRICGCAVPRHTDFPEINLRYYVRRIVGREIRRGVVFVQEIVPRRLIAMVANRIYHENYVCRPMRTTFRTAGANLNVGDTLAYSWRSAQRVRFSSHAGAPDRWNTLAARVADPIELPRPGSLAEFIVEHYWGYAHGRDGQTREYRVAHDPWRVAPANNVTWDCDVAANFSTPLAKYLISPPTTALVADGAAVEVFLGRKI
jgi:hypothetical protein